MPYKYKDDYNAYMREYRKKSKPVNRKPNKPKPSREYYPDTNDSGRIKAIKLIVKSGRGRLRKSEVDFLLTFF